jgi:hypothetical protein
VGRKFQHFDSNQVCENRSAILQLSVKCRYVICNLSELGIRYFFPFSLFALPLLQHLFSLSLLRYRYFSENCNTLLAIRYRYLCFISVADCINFRAISLVKDPQHWLLIIFKQTLISF